MHVFYLTILFSWLVFIIVVIIIIIIIIISSYYSSTNYDYFVSYLFSSQLWFVQGPEKGYCTVAPFAVI